MSLPVININDINDPHKRQQLVHALAPNGAVATFEVRATPGHDAFHVSTVRYEGRMLGFVHEETRSYSYGSTEVFAVQVERRTFAGSYHGQAHQRSEEGNGYVQLINTTALITITQAEQPALTAAVEAQ